jgi:hypothetical protein
MKQEFERVNFSGAFCREKMQASSVLYARHIASRA